MKRGAYVNCGGDLTGYTQQIRIEGLEAQLTEC